jgi:hypothetical protein
VVPIFEVIAALAITRSGWLAAYELELKTGMNIDMAKHKVKAKHIIFFVLIVSSPFKIIY